MEKIDYATYKKPSDFLELVEGDNVIRVVSEGGIATIYGMNASRWIRFGETVPEKTLADAKAKGYEDSIVGTRKWIWVAINRTTGQVGILEVGPQIGDAICKIAKKKNLNAQDIDYNVNRVGVGLRSKYHVEAILETKPLTPAELKKVEKEKPFLVKKRYGKTNTSND